MTKLPALAALAIALTANISCEQQTYEQTKMFNQNRHSEGHGDAHGEKAGAHAATPETHAPAAH